MSIEAIRAEVAALRRRFPYADAEEICDALKIGVMELPMGDSPEACKGFFIRKARIKKIVINSCLPDEHRHVILPHELGHGVLHGKTERECAFHDFALFDDTAVAEYEANIFVAEFLLRDEEVLDLLNDDMSFFRAAAVLQVPPELLDFKFRVLKRQGYAINPPLYSNSDFLKDIDRFDRF